MKKFLSLLTAIIIVTAAILTSLPAFAEEKIDMGVFSADKYAVTGSKNQSVKFTAEIKSSRNLGLSKVKLADDSGNLVSYMHDDGKAGDDTANDGIYTAVCNLYNEKVCTINYHAEVNGKKSSSFPVKFNKEITDADFDTAYRIWDKLGNIENALAEKGFSPEEIADAAYEWLIENESGNLATIKRENPKAFSFTLSTGIENYFEHFENETSCENAEQIRDAVRSMSYIGTGSIGVWSPYYGYDSSFSYNYLERAKAMQEVAGYETVDSYYGSQANVESFKNFDKYGVIMIDSHGADYNGGGYICIPAPGNYDHQDVAEGHIVLSGGTVYLRGTFMKKYCDTLPNSIIYIGICYGMAADNLYRPLLEHGAGFCCGYTDSVSFAFDGIMMDEFCMQLVLENAVTGTQNTAGEAFDKAVELHGVVDPYGDARFIWKGNSDVVASGIKTPVESVSFDPSEITIYRNNELKLSPVITPAEANRYSLTWESSDPETVSVSGNGTVTALQSGEAVIHLTLTDNADEEEKIFTADCKVIVDGDMPVSGVMFIENTVTVYEGMTYGLKTQVLPDNATNKNITFSTSDENIVTVDENGVITPKEIGNAEIIVTTEDGGYTAKCSILVNEKTLNAALNKTNGTLSFTASGTTPDINAEGERLYARTNNKSNNSSASFMLNTHLNKGDMLVFDWRVSSEYGYDVFYFYANGMEIENISGEKQWETVTYTAESERDFTFEWRYQKDYSTADGDDCGMLDEVDIIRENETHTVTFYDMDRETVIEAQEVAHGSTAVPPQAPVHDGYAFTGWEGDYSNVRADVSVYALYEEKTTHTVTFLDMDGETVIAVVEVSDSEAAQAPEAPEHEGYTFTGWDRDISCVTEDMTVIAVYEINVYTVTFLDMDGKTVIKECEVEYGGSPEEPEAPEHEGYEFIGWDKDFSEVKEDMTVTAIYEVIKYKVIFFDMDGDTIIAEVEVEYGKAAEAPEAPEHKGYIFIGWDKEFTAVYDNMKVHAVYKLFGDANDDGKTNTSDAVIILKYAAGMITDFDETMLKVCDLSSDGKVNTADAALILKYAAGMIQEF